MNRLLLIQTLVGAEGWRRTAYDDKTGEPLKTVGNQSIGCGRNLSANPLSDAEINFILATDIDRALSAAGNILPNYPRWDDVRQRAIAEMMFNLGSARFNGFVKMWSALRDEDWEGAAKALLDSLYYQELPERVERLAAMIATGTDAASNAAMES